MAELSLSTRDMDIHIALTMSKFGESALPRPTWVNKDGEAPVLRDDLVASIRKDIDANKSLGYAGRGLSSVANPIDTWFTDIAGRSHDAIHDTLDIGIGLKLVHLSWHQISISGNITLFCFEFKKCRAKDRTELGC